MSRANRRAKYIAACIAGAVVISLIGSNALRVIPLAEPSNPNKGTPPASDPLTHIAKRYAPFIYAATEHRGGRQDIISNIDFDGDLVGNNNWENFDRFELKPTVYFAILETETHYFISYHLFHPRDWNHFTVWLNDTHENDGENFQVVVRKSDDRIVMLWTQGHYKSRVYTFPASGIDSGKVPISGPFQTVDASGEPGQDEDHVCVFVESQGHGIYSTLDPASDVRVDANGSYNFGGGAGLLFRPAVDGEEVREPRDPTSGEAAYQLDSTTMRLWPLLRDDKLSGGGRLLDGSYRYEDEFIEIKEVPRFYDADRFSGPLGNDRGISPFALDFSFNRGTLGALFFNPARRYADQLKIAGPWSTRYIDYPFARSS